MAQTKIISGKIKSNGRHWKNFLDKEYLGSHNIEEGEEMILTIAKFEGEEMVLSMSDRKTKVPKQVLYFKEDNPKLIMNVTNGNMISKLYGQHPDKWVGKKIQIYVDKNVKQKAGNVGEGLRIRELIPEREVDAATHGARLEAAKTLPELVAAWNSIPLSAKNDEGLKKIKDARKELLSVPQS